MFSVVGMYSSGYLIVGFNRDCEKVSIFVHINDWIDDGENPNDYPDDWLMTLDKSCHTRADAQDGEFKLPPKEE